jgi:hypothetical protein
VQTPLTLDRHLDKKKLIVKTLNTSFVCQGGWAEERRKDCVYVMHSRINVEKKKETFKVKLG